MHPQLKRLIYPLHRLFILTALLSLLLLALSSLVIESVTYRPTDDEQPSAAEAISAPFIRPNNRPEEATLALHYRGYGNTMLRLTPTHCFKTGYYTNNQFHEFPDRRDTWCQPLLIDLSADLREGANTLVIPVIPDFNRLDHYSPIVGVTTGPPLFGEYLPHSILTVIFTGSILALLWLFLAKQHFNIISRIIFISGCALYTVTMQKVAQFGFSLDLEKHIPYVQYMSEHFWPHEYRMAESWHPAAYYTLASVIARLFQFTGVFDPWTGVRLLALCCYVTFMYFGMRSIARVLKGVPFYLALSILMFWPSGLFNAAWAFNDVLMYPIYAASFYYTLVWYETGQLRPLINTILLCGAAFTVKTTALVPTAILGLCVLFKLITRQCTLRSLIRKETLWSGVALALGVFCNFSGMLYDKYIMHQTAPPHLGGDGGYTPNFDSLFFVDVRDLITHPFFNSWEDPYMWVVTIKTMLFTNSYMRFPLLGSSLMALFFAMTAYTLVYMCTIGRKRYAQLFPVITGVQLPFIALLCFTLMAGNSACRDFRYVQPALVAMSALFMLAVQEAKCKDYVILYYLGNITAALFSIISITFFLEQFS